MAAAAWPAILVDGGVSDAGEGGGVGLSFAGAGLVGAPAETLEAAEEPTGAVSMGAVVASDAATGMEAAAADGVACGSGTGKGPAVGPGAGCGARAAMDVALETGVASDEGIADAASDVEVGVVAAGVGEAPALAKAGRAGLATISGAGGRGGCGAGGGGTAATMSASGAAIAFLTAGFRLVADLAVGGWELGRPGEAGSGGGGSLGDDTGIGVATAG